MNEEQQRQIKIDADIEEVIKTIQGLGLKCDEQTIPTHHCREERGPKRNRWMKCAVWTITAFTIGAFTGVVGAYKLHLSNAADHPPFAGSPEIRRAIPVHPEIRRAIPVQPEIRKAIPLRIKATTEVRS